MRGDGPRIRLEGAQGAGRSNIGGGSCRSSEGADSMRPVVQDASVVDLFCGAGGLSQGFYQEGFRIAAGVDADEDCRHAFERNNGGKFLRRNIVDVTAAEVADAFGSRTMVWRLRREPLTRRRTSFGATLSHKGRGKIGVLAAGRVHTRIGIST